MLSLDDFRFGIEHEFPAIDTSGRFCDYATSTFDELDRVLAGMPIFETDYPGLRVGDLGIKSKRWYIEGFERFSGDGAYLRTDPKGFEIRTPICGSLAAAVDTLHADFARWQREARPYGYRPGWTSFNPYREDYVPDPPLNAWEVADRSTPEEQTAHIHMLTYGPDISFSHPDLSVAQTIDIARKLTWYSPYIVPFSFSSPFHCGGLWGGLSRRTFHRTGPRPSVLVFVSDTADVVPSFPTLTDRARVPAEAGRIEFKAFDCPRSLDAYRALGTLLLGLALDTTLSGRATVPSAELHQLSAARGFDAAEVRTGAAAALAAAREALPSALATELRPLDDMLASGRTPAHAMIDRFRQTGDIIATITGP